MSGLSSGRLDFRLQIRLETRHLIELQHDGVLTAVAEQRARMAIVRDLLRHPGVWHDRETSTNEERRVVRERAQARIALAARADGQVFDHADAESEPTRVLADDQRTHLGNGW